MTKFYLMTMKSNAKVFITLSHLRDSYNLIVKSDNGFEWSDQVAYELDSLYRLHIHTILCARNNISLQRYTKKWSQLAELHVHLVPLDIDTLPMAQAYVKKELRTPDELEQVSIVHLAPRLLPKVQCEADPQDHV